VRENSEKILIALAVTHFACTGSPRTDQGPEGPAVVVGGGPTLYWNQDLRLANDDGLVAAAVVGFKTVEVFRITDPEPTVRAVIAPTASPPCDRMPVAIVPGDYDGDGVRDLWVQEACGGNWISAGPEYTANAPSVTVLPGEPGPMPYVEYYETPDGAILLGGTTREAYAMQKLVRGWSEPAWLPIPGAPPWDVAKVWAPLGNYDAASGSQEFLFQGNEALHVVTASNGQLRITRTLAQKLAPPYVRPFAAYDHLTTLSPTTCSNTALGIGLFSRYAAGTPRRLQILRLVDGTTYQVYEPDLALESVTTFSALPIDGGPVVVSVLGKRAARDVFVLGSVEGCSEVRTLAELEVSFDVKTPPLPERYAEEFVPRTNGLRLVPFYEAGTAYFAHYDGYDIRLVVAHQVGSGWELEERRHEIHAERNDSSWRE
jgi:hypothetical protein